MKKARTIIILVVLVLVGFGAFRAAQVISAKKEEKKTGLGQIPLVDVAPATQGLIEERILRTGDIIPHTQVTIYSKVQGWVENINVREGDRVIEGQVLVTLDVREAEATVGQAQANLEAARARLQQVKATAEETVQTQIQQTKANLELAEADLRRFQELYDKNFVARQQLDEAQTRRLVDFISGVTYALDGHMKRVARGVYLCSPTDIPIEELDMTPRPSSSLFDYEAAQAVGG